MNHHEVISSGLLENYVLGNTTAEESAMIRRLCKEHPELIREIELIEESLVDFSSKLSQPLDPTLKEKISSQLDFGKEKSSSDKIVSLITRPEEKIKLYKFGIAASLLLFMTSFVYNVMLQQKLDRVNSELAELSAAKSYMADELKIQQASIRQMNTELHIVADPMVKTIALNGMNSLEKKSAMVHWNTKTMEVYFNASALPMSPPDKQYQLWAIVDGKPIDAGMIDLSNTGSVFQKMKSIQGAQAFAVTIEKMGGSQGPTMETMCLMGKI